MRWTFIYLTVIVPSSESISCKDHVQEYLDCPPLSARAKMNFIQSM